MCAISSGTYHQLITFHLVLTADAIRRTNNKKFSAATDDDIATHAKNWLKNSGDRDGGRKRRATKAKVSKLAKASAHATVAAANVTKLVVNLATEDDQSEQLYDSEATDCSQSILQDGTCTCAFLYGHIAHKGLANSTLSLLHITSRTYM